MEYQDKLNKLASLIEKEQKERLIIDGLGCQCNIDNCKTKIKEGKKYFKIDIGSSGKYMIDREGNIFGIKGYGVINKKKQYGTLDTINDYYWGEYRAFKK